MFSPSIRHYGAIVVVSGCVALLLVTQAASEESFEQTFAQQNLTVKEFQNRLETHLTIYAESVQIEVSIRQPDLDQRNVEPSAENGHRRIIYRSENHPPNMVAISISLPPSRTSDKAQAFIDLIEYYADIYDQEPALILAIMHSESSFNPEARSRIPALGLMQIVPQSAGRDITRILYGEAQVMPSSYYYDPENSVRAGVVYLDLLMTTYLRHIEHPESRLYAAVAAYNTGAGNVARAFTGTTSIKDAAQVINQMTPEAVYTHLVDNLPYDETRRYLGHVIALQVAYRDWF